MYDRRTFISYVLTGLGALSAAGLGSAAQAAGCAYPAGEFVQIEVSDLSRRAQNFAAYRITENGMVSGVRWSGGRELVGLTAPNVLSPMSFKAAKTAVAKALSEPKRAPTTRGAEQFTNWVSLARSTAQRTEHRVFLEPSRTVADLANTLSTSVPLQKPTAGGHYILTSPVEFAETLDLTARSDACSDPVAQGIIQSLSSGQIAVRLNQPAPAYFEGEKQRRAVFAAQISGRFTHFTIVRS